MNYSLTPSPSWIFRAHQLIDRLLRTLKQEVLVPHLILGFCVLGLPLPCLAQEAAPLEELPRLVLPAADPQTTKEAGDEDDKALKFSGYADAFYRGNPMDSEDGEALTFPTSYNKVANTFGLGMINVQLEKQMDRVGFVGQLGFGPRAAIANGDGNFGDEFGANWSQLIQQLYVTYSPREFLTLTLGSFSSFIGYESINAPGNLNYSGGYLFTTGPFYHTGAKVEVGLEGGFGAMVGVFNDTNAKADAVEGKHIGAQLSVDKGKLKGYLNFLSGKENDSDPDDRFHPRSYFIDAILSYDFTESTLIALNLVDRTVVSDGDQITGVSGLAVYLSKGLTKSFDLALRTEYYSLKKNESVSNQDTRNVTSFTLSGSWHQGALRVIPEIRYDLGGNFTENNYHSAINFSDSAADTEALNLVLAAVYSF